MSGEKQQCERSVQEGNQAVRTRLSTVLTLWDAVLDHFVPSSPCAGAMVQCADDRNLLEIGFKCSRCGQSWAIHIRDLRDTIEQNEPEGTIRVWGEREVTE